MIKPFERQLALKHSSGQVSCGDPLNPTIPLSPFYGAPSEVFRKPGAGVLCPLAERDLTQRSYRQCHAQGASLASVSFVRAAVSQNRFTRAKSIKPCYSPVPRPTP